MLHHSSSSSSSYLKVKGLVEVENLRTREIRVGTDLWWSSSPSSPLQQDCCYNRAGQSLARLAKSCTNSWVAIAQLHWVIFPCAPQSSQDDTFPNVQSEPPKPQLASVVPCFTILIIHPTPCSSFHHSSMGSM